MREKRCGKLHGHSMIAQIVGRLHVGTPDDEAFEYTKGRLKRGEWEKLSPSIQRSFRCEVLRVHHRNRDLYTAVMRGF